MKAAIGSDKLSYVPRRWTNKDILGRLINPRLAVDNVDIVRVFLSSSASE